MLGLTGPLLVLHEGFISPTVFGSAHVDVCTQVDARACAFGSLGAELLLTRVLEAARPTGLSLTGRRP
jgi:hypothetical protein